MYISLYIIYIYSLIFAIDKFNPQADIESQSHSLVEVRTPGP